MKPGPLCSSPAFCRRLDGGPTVVHQSGGILAAGRHWTFGHRLLTTRAHRIACYLMKWSDRRGDEMDPLQISKARFEIALLSRAAHGARVATTMTMTLND